jgi:threonine aldolase
MKVAIVEKGDLAEAERRLKSACEHMLCGHLPRPPRALLEDLALDPRALDPADFYGAGGAVATLENRTAQLLGKERGLFVINGVTAQLAALRSHATQAGSTIVAVPLKSHVDIDEQGALERVGGLTLVRLGRERPFGLAELEKVDEPIAAVVVELPLRRIGYQLPPINELHAVSAFCRSRGIALHFDGARIWEAAAGYGVDLSELAGLADSVYVSFYKGIGGLGGAVVVGSNLFVGSLLNWKIRFGGNLFTAFPYAIAAHAGLDTHLGRMESYVERARELARRLDARFLVTPAPPHVNAFQLILSGDPDTLAERNRAFAREHGVWLFNGFADAAASGKTVVEIVIGNAADNHSIEQSVEWIEAFAR